MKPQDREKLATLLLDLTMAQYDVTHINREIADCCSDKERIYHEEEREKAIVTRNDIKALIFEFVDSLVTWQCAYFPCTLSLDFKEQSKCT